MGLVIRLENERGELLAPPVFDPTNALRAIMPWQSDQAYPLLRFVDPYADTTFNHLQVEVLVEEWARVSERATTKAQREIVEAVAELARLCLSKVHAYIKFVGD